MKKFIVEFSSEAFLRLSAHAASLNTTAEQLAARFLCGCYCADEYDEPDLRGWIEHGMLHADPDVLDTDEGVRAFYDHQLLKD